jgi:glycyl-tRNA synthetase (class II)
VSERKFVPNVIEPSFGIGRIITGACGAGGGGGKLHRAARHRRGHPRSPSAPLTPLYLPYCAGILEHTFSVREGDEQRAVLSFPAAISPYKAVVLPLDSRIPRGGLVADIAGALTSGGLAANIDDSSASIGKRYARADEIGVPFALTVDHESVAAPKEAASVTIRERDSCGQVRVPVADVPALLRSLVDGSAVWADVVASGKYTVVTTGEDKAATATVARLA